MTPTKDWSDDFDFYLLWSRVLGTDDDKHDPDWISAQAMVWAEFDSLYGLTG